MNFATAIEELAAQLVKRLPAGKQNVYAYAPNKLELPAVMFGWPEDPALFDVTYQRGYDQLAVPLYVLVDRSSDRETMRKMAPYVAGSGEYSIKAILESDDAAYTELDRSSLMVRWPRFEPTTVAEVPCYVAIFMIVFTGRV